MADFFDDRTVFVLDSYGLIYREYFAFISHPLTNSKKENVSAVYGFFRNLYAIVKRYNPQYLVAAFDSRTPTFRHEMFGEYKANRAKTPDDLIAQIPWIESLLGVLGVPLLRCDGFEADDIIATVAKHCRAAGRHCAILSADKDLMQLACDTTHILKPDKAQVWAEVDAAGVAAEWGVPPEKLLDLLSLMGDTADNVPGVKGIGPKSAVKLLNQYGDLDAILAHAEAIGGAQGEHLRAGKDDALLSRRLITLRDDVPCVHAPDEFKADALHFKETATELIAFELPAVAKLYMTLATESGENIVASSSRKAVLRVQNEIKTAKQNEGKYRALTDAGEFAAFVDGIIAAGGSVALDTETDRLETFTANLVGFSMSVKAGEGFYVPLILNDALFAETMPKKDALDTLARLFNAPNVTIVFHNAKFDIEVLWTNGLGKLVNPQHEDDIHFAAAIADTMIAAWLIEPDRLGKVAYGLEHLAETKLSLKGTEYAEIVPRNGTFADVPLETAAQYGAEDADFTWQLWQYYLPLLKASPLYDLFAGLEMKVLPILAGMELRGIHLDAPSLASYETELKAHLAATMNETYALVGHEFNIASPQQVGKVLYEERGLKPGKKTKRGFSTDSAVLEELAAQDPVPQKILEYRNLAKLLSTYVETLPDMTDEHGRIHTSFIQTGTATGRLSSRDPNLQNIPVREEAGRRIRAAFTAAPGTVLISADYSQIELVVLAHLSGDPQLCAAFNEGTDVHKSTAALIYGIPAAQVTPEMRRTAKTINFGVMYGMGAFRLARELGIPMPRAKEFIEQYFAQYAGIEGFIENTIKKAEETGYVETLFGRRRPLLAITSANKMEKNGAERVATNTPIQGTAADIVKKAMIAVDDALREHPTGARLLLQVHDELIFECPDDETTIADTIALVKERMEHAVQLDMPLRVSVEYGNSWGLFH
ncbi:MAG: DNA polymerase I [Treponemataceae bacterium]|nr:DNA polymerase I [Treponemataceae bacterium]